MPRLCLLRHGITRGAGGDPDLSAEGVQLMRDEARGIARLGLDFDLILTSPLRRAEQTALIVAEALHREKSVVASEPLAGGCRGSSLIAVIERHRDPVSVLAVGHQPDMGRIAADLIGAPPAIAFDKGSLCCLDVTDWAALRGGQRASLQFLLPAAVLAALK